MTIVTRPLVPLLVGAALLGCSASPSADFAVPITSDEWGAFTVLINDGSGLVNGAQAAEWQPGMMSDEVVAMPERQELEIGWTGGACQHTPVVTVTGTTEMLHLSVQNPNDPQLLPFLPMICPSVGIPLRVALTLTEPVEQDAVDLDVSY